MSAEQNFAQAFTGEKTGLGALQFDFFEFLTALALKFCRGKSCLARQFVHQLQQRFSVIAEACEGNRTVVLACVDGKVSAKTAKKFFDFAAGMLCGSRAHHGRSHFRECGSTRSCACVARPKKQLAVEFWNSVRFEHNHFETVSKF